MSAQFKEVSHVTRGENTATLPLTTQQRTCRCCNGLMDAQYQPALLPGRAGYWLITCWNKTCDLNAYTFSHNSYPTIDLQLYLAKD